MLKRHLGFAWNEVLGLEIGRAKKLYQQWQDERVIDRCFQMSLHKVDYRNAHKFGTTYYVDYLEEMEERKERPDIKSQLIQVYQVKEKLEVPERLRRHNKKCRTRS